MNSIIQKTKECYFCGATYDLHEHHIFGSSNRKWSEKYGLKVWLCAGHHNMSNNSVHFNSIYMKLLHIIGQLYFEKEYDEEFLKIFYRNYLEEER